METVKRLFVTKRFHTYTDTFLLLGLARVVELALRETQQPAQMQLVNESSRYRIEFKRPIRIEPMAHLSYADPFQPILGKSTKRSLIPSDAEPFDTVEAAQVRRTYLEARSQGKTHTDTGDPIPPPDPKTQNGITLTSMRSDKNHNEIWLAGRAIESHYGCLIVSLLQAFSQPTYPTLNGDIEATAKYFQAATSTRLPGQASAIKIYLPTAVEGVNRLKADSNKTDRKKADWLVLWLIANGFFTFAIAESVKVAEKKFDRRVLALDPQDIRLSSYRDVLDSFRRFSTPSGSHGVARFDAELVLRFCLELLKHHHSQAEGRPEDDLELCQPINRFVRGFAGTGFGSKGQVYGVKELFTLGLPAWIQPRRYDDLQAYQQVLTEHLSVVRSLSVEEGHSELLAAYRDFITSSTNDALNQFFRFQVSYADYVTKKLADPKAKYPPKLFSKEGLDVMTDSFRLRQEDREWSIAEITQNEGFRRIARAINSATVYAGKIKTKAGTIELDWQRTYGLAQRLSNHAGSKKDFIAELTAFLTSYENENLRLSEQLQKEGKELKRVWVTNEDLENFLALFDDPRFSSSLIANLLLAYGYARWRKPLQDEPQDAPVDPADDDAQDDDLETLSDNAA